MIDPQNLLGLKDIIFCHVDKGHLEARNGTIFICPLAGGPLRFLHKLYGGGSSDSRQVLQHLFGFALPDDYLRFMHTYNGATLFDNSLFLYGVVSQFNRGLTLEEQQPVSLEGELENSRVMHDAAYPWRPFGSVAGYEKLFQLELDASGRARMQRKDGQARMAGSVGGLIRSLAEFFVNHTDANGFIDQTKKSMDVALSQFVESKH